MFKFDDIVAMQNVGIRKATSHTLSPKGAYTLTRFKSEVARLYAEWQDRGRKISNEVGIEDGKAFYQRYKELCDKKCNKEEQKELDAAKDKIARLTAMQNELDNDEVTINCTPMSYEDWFNLINENKGLVVNITDNNGKVLDSYELFGFIESLSEGILWAAPAE